MPKCTSFELCEAPYSYKGNVLSMKKSYTTPNFKSNTILTDDIFPYVEFYFSSHKKAMKYKNPSSKSKYGNENKYHYSFYWTQAMTFYCASKTLPIESVPLLSYYSMLNAVKAFLSFKCEYIEDFVEHFKSHGLSEDSNATSAGLDGIAVYRKETGVFPLFGRKLEPAFSSIWENGKAHPITMKKLLYNLAYIHRAYITTYSASKGAKIPELFIPLVAGQSPCYHKANDGLLYLTIDVDKRHFPTNSTSIPPTIMATLSPEFILHTEGEFVLRSARGVKKNTTESISRELKDSNDVFRREFQYIRSEKRLWYLKRATVASIDVLNLNSMLITMATMHRFSEIVRYKPEELAHLMTSKENWLIHEFLSLALDQFIDEIAAEITGQDIMSTRYKA